MKIKYGTTDEDKEAKKLLAETRKPKMEKPKKNKINC